MEKLFGSPTPAQLCSLSTKKASILCCSSINSFDLEVYLLNFVVLDLAVYTMRLYYDFSIEFT